MKLIEIKEVSSQSNQNWGSTHSKSLVLPHDLEFENPLGQKLLHKEGTKVSFKILSGTPFKIKLFRTSYSIILTYDSKKEFTNDGFEI
jgi:hypothetical protein